MNIAPNRGFRDRQFTGVIEIYIWPTPVAMATKIGEFYHKNWLLLG